MAISPNILDRDKAAYKENATDGGLDRRVTDVTSQEKLDAIANALGAATNTTATIINVAVATANTEVSQLLPTNTKSFILKARGNSKIQMSFISGDSGTTFVTIPKGAVYTDDKFYTSLTVYFQTSNGGETVEIIAYT